MSSVDLDIVQGLLEVVSPQEGLRLKVLHNATVQTFREYKDSPTKATLANWKAAKGELAAEVERLQGQSAGAGSAPVAWGEFKDTKVKAEVLRFLQAMGFDVAERTFFRQCAQGKLKKNDKGLYSRRLVRAYAETTWHLAGGGETAARGESSLMAARLEEQVNRERINRQRDEIRLQRESGAVVDRGDLNIELAARLVVLDAGVKKMINESGMEWIVLVGGNTERLPDLLQAMTAGWEQLLDGYADRATFEVAFEDEAGSMEREA